MGSANPLPSAKQSQTDELDLPQHLRLNRRSREPDLPANPRPMVHIELAKAVELESESIRVQMGEQGGLAKLRITALTTCSASFLVGSDKAR